MGCVGVFSLGRSRSGQSLLETAFLIPLLLYVVLNFFNFGYFLLVVLNVSAAARSGVVYSIMGNATLTGSELPSAGPITYNTQDATSANTSVSSLALQDLVGTLATATSASVQACLKLQGYNNAGQASQTALCETCTISGSSSSGACTSPATGTPAPSPDPESPSFVLQRVDLTYTFSPLIPGVAFGVFPAMTSACSTISNIVTCQFHRQVSMRALD
jgi:Flp pilus assembly protein TadG